MISNRAIERLKSGKISENKTNGLFIEVTGLRKVWRYRRRISHTNQTVNLTLGAYPAFDIEAARAWAQSLNLLVEAGRDPRTLAVTTKDEITVREAHGHYLEDCRSGDRRMLKARTIRDKEQRGRLDILPAIGDLALAAVTADQLWRIVENKGRTAKVRANRLAAEIKVFFKWCQSRAAAQHGIRLLDDPAASLSGKYYRESLGRTRILSDDEIVWFVRAVMQQRNPAVRRLYMVLLLTGVRLNEAAEAPASEYAYGVWTIAGERTKNMKPLRREARALKECVADLTLENRLLKKSMIGNGDDDA